MSSSEARGPRINLSMSVDDASAVADAISYWLMAAQDNYGSGYERGNMDDAEARTEWRRVNKIGNRLNAKIEAMDR